jgi:hypothetical protein
MIPRLHYKALRSDILLLTNWFLRLPIHVLAVSFLLFAEVQIEIDVVRIAEQGIVACALIMSMKYVRLIQNPRLPATNALHASKMGFRIENARKIENETITRSTNLYVRETRAREASKAGEFEKRTCPASKTRSSSIHAKIW